MRKMKKLASLLLALVMVLSMGVTAMADDTKYTITITYEASGHTYEAYQIFKGDLYETYTKYTGSEGLNSETQLYLCKYDASNDTYTYTAEIKVSDYVSDPADTTTDNVTTTGYYYVSGTVLSNIDWGSGVNGEALLTALKSDETVVDTDGSGGNITIKDMFANCTTAADVAKVLSDNNTNAALAEQFAQLVNKNLTTEYAGQSSGSTEKEDQSGNTYYEYTISGLSAGYYLVKDKDDSVTAEGDSYTDIILEVITNVSVAAKADTVSLDKTITGTTTDQSTDGTNCEDDTTADYTVGDDVPFTLTAKLPSNYDDYNTYKLTFHDTLTSGLSFNDSSIELTVYTAQTGLTSWDNSVTYYTFSSAAGGFVEVNQTGDTFDGNKTYYTKAVVASGYTLVTTGFTDGCTFEVQIANVNALYEDQSAAAINVTNSSIITVTYTARLLDTAKTTQVETNKAYLEYSNNPNDTGTGSTGTTPEDETTVFVFTLNVNKVDSSNKALEGAAFTLYKATEQENLTDFANGTTYYTINNDVMTEVASTETIDDEKIYYVYTAVGSEVNAGYQQVSISNFESGVTYYTTTDNINYTKVTTETFDTAETYYVKNEFSFEGLGTGYYKLVETTTPSGYNTMDDYYFTITAKTKEDSTGASVTELVIKDADGNALSGASASDPSFTVSSDNKTIDTDIKNQAGSTLPSTGGIGTTIFYIVGTIMVLGAAVVLITRRRMRSAE